MPPQCSRILVVDDLETNRLLLQSFLESEGYAVELASDANSAITQIENSPPDLVLLDVMMPDMDGYELTQQIRLNHKIPPIPIVLVTAHEQTSEKQGFAAGADDFVCKPLSLKDLLIKLKVYCD
jgi:two-component system, sensor histidine kinase and response regulator